MAAVLSETITESSYFPKMRRGDERQRSPPPQYQNGSRNRDRVPPSPRPHPTNTIPGGSSSQPYPQAGPDVNDDSVRQTVASQSTFSRSSQQHPSRHDPASSQASDHIPPTRYTPQAVPPPLASPADSNNSPIARSPWSSENISASEPNVIKVRDLAHIQSFATEEFLSSRSNAGRRRAGTTPPLRYEISAMPIADIIEMVAGLLTKITTTNDRQHENLHRPLSSSDTSGNMSGLTSSVLAFHGKNVPSITILSYLSRIHKYCPTTYEVFLSLLVYFDRMTERVNAAPLQDMRRGSAERSVSRPSTGTRSAEEESEVRRTPLSPSVASSSEELARAHYATPPDDDQVTYHLSHFFVVDSFNIHRLVIAGVTCASKFFSDVFYTNSRYAKVGGLPLAELNHLELQFLLLNDFRLSVPVEELEAYGTMLVEFYAREVIAQRQQTADMAYADDSEDTAMVDPTSP